MTAVTASQVEATENGDKLIWTLEKNLIESPTAVLTPPNAVLSFPLEIGKKWSYKFGYANKQNGSKGRLQVDATVVAFEKVKVPAGEFDTFKIEYKGFWNNDTRGWNGAIRNMGWYAPAARAFVKFESADGFNDNIRVLVEYQLQP